MNALVTGLGFAATTPGRRAQAAMRPKAMLVAAAFLVALLVPATPALAQPAATPTGPASEASPMFQRHHAMAGLMKDMAETMRRMQEDMADFDKLSPETRRHMADDMKRMSRLMQRMSGWADRPTMNESEMRRQYEEMRREMEAMSRAHGRVRPGGAR